MPRQKPRSTSYPHSSPHNSKPHQFDFFRRIKCARTGAINAHVGHINYITLSGCVFAGFLRAQKVRRNRQSTCAESAHPFRYLPSIPANLEHAHCVWRAACDSNKPAVPPRLRVCASEWQGITRERTRLGPSRSGRSFSRALAASLCAGNPGHRVENYTLWRSHHSRETRYSSRYIQTWMHLDSAEISAQPRMDRRNYRDFGSCLAETIWSHSGVG